MGQYPQVDVHIEPPGTDNPLNSQMMQNLRDQFDVTEESHDFGIEMYLNVKRYVKNLIVWNYIGNLEYVQMLLVLIPDVKFVSNLFSNIEIRCF